MIYRIIFNPDTASWQVELQRLGFLWKPVMTKVNTGEPLLEPRRFDNYELAASFVKEKGIDKVYRNWGSRPTVQLMHGYQPHPSISE